MSGGGGGLLGRALAAAAVSSRRSPIRLRCERNKILRRKVCNWSCDESVRAARFTHRTDPDRFVIVHPSTKLDTAGKWQTSYFDADGPVRDTRASTCTKALRELHHKKWRLVEVVG